MSAAGVPSPVRIIGTGLIGGSLGLALGATGTAVQIEDASPGTEALAVEMGAGTRATPADPDPALVLVAAPPDISAALVAGALARWPAAVVADVASVKATVLAGVRAAVADGRLTASDLTRYVGAHPMAGREVSGVVSARGDLFRSRPFVVVPHADSDPEAVAALHAVAAAIGSVALTLDADAHDLSVAHVSHVPQVVASLLGASLLHAPDRALELAGQGVRDTSRIAASDPRLWVEILSANAAAVEPILRDLRGRLDAVLGALGTLATDPDPRHGSRRTIAGLIDEGSRGVRRIPGRHGGAAETFAAVTVLVPDRPGELGRLLTEMGEAGINLEDLSLEHSLGATVGLAHVSVEQGSEALLTHALRERGWSVAEG